MVDMVSIPKKEYDRLKKMEKEQELEDSLKRSLDDAKAGRITRVA